MSDNFTIAVAVNSRETLRQNLLRSPGLTNGSRHQIIVKENFQSASLAYNSAIDEATNDVIVFVHQDVYLPEAWFGNLNSSLAWLQTVGAHWGVIGCYGSRKNAPGGLGRIYTRGIGRHGRELSQPEPIETLDEIILIIRKSSGLRFDPNLPHFHLYGTDLCMTARDRGMTNYAFQGFCVHNTNQLLMLPREFYTCYRHLRRKWAKSLPIYTSCTIISSSLNSDFYRRRIVEAGKRALRMTSLGQRRVEDPRVLADEESA
jgi:hypothetical protein